MNDNNNKNKYNLKSIIIKALIISFSIMLVIIFIDSLQATLSQKQERGILGFLTEIALGMLEGTISFVFISIGLVTKLIINFLQEAIFQLFSGKIIWSSLHISYKEYLAYISSIFLVLMIIFTLGMIWNKLMNRKNKNQNTFFIFVKSILIFILAPLVLQILFLSTSLVMEWIVGDANLINLFDFIFNTTIKMIISTDNIVENFAILIFFGAASIWVAIILVKFTFTLSMRIFELIIYGLIGIPFVAAANMEDGGERYQLWKGIMLTKILSPFFCLLGYIIALTIIPVIVSGLKDVDIHTHYISSDLFVIGITLVLSISAFSVITSMMTKWSMLISPTKQNSLLEDMNKISIKTTGTFKVINKTDPVNLKKFERNTQNISSSKRVENVSKTNVQNISNEKNVTTKQVNNSYVSRVHGMKGKEKEEARNKWIENHKSLIEKKQNKNVKEENK